MSNDGLTPFDATGAACVGDEAGFYSACLHAGEWLQMSVPGEASCVGLTATDALGAFDWQCRDDAGEISFVSTRLNPQARLGGLIDMGTQSWRDNTLTVRDGSNQVVASSTTGPWHDNPISEIIGTTNVLSGSETVYVAAASSNATVSIEADGAAVVTASDATIVSATTPAGVQRRFLWVEGNFVSGTEVVRLYDSRFSVVRGLWGDGSLRLERAEANRLEQLHLATNNVPLYVDADSRFNLFEDVSITGGHASGLSLHGQNNVFAGMLAASNVVGLYVQSGADANVLMSVASHANSNRALWNSSADATTVLGFASVNSFRGISVSNSAGFEVRDAVITDQIVSASVGGIGIERNAGSTVTVSGIYRGGNNSADCVIGIAAEPCANFGSDLSYATGFTLVSSMVGATTDTANPDDDGSGQASFSLLLNQLAWDDLWRGWGLAATLPSLELRGDCFTGDTCQVWDWSWLAGDAVASDLLNLPNQTNAVSVMHLWDADQSGCADIPGAQWYGSMCASGILAHARELAFDGVGNDNLICEATETCVVQPNVGPYQGHGGLVDAGAGGVSGDVRLLRYVSNGR